MEQFYRLPQIPISLLQKIAFSKQQTTAHIQKVHSSSPFFSPLPFLAGSSTRHQSSSNFAKLTHKSRLVEVQKPYYVFDRKQMNRHICQSHNVRCKCRQLKCINGEKHLKSRGRSGSRDQDHCCEFQKINNKKRYRTELAEDGDGCGINSQITRHIDFQAYVQQQLAKHRALNKEPTQVYQKYFTKRIFEKYKYIKDQLQVRTRIKQFVIAKLTYLINDEDLIIKNRKQNKESSRSVKNKNTKIERLVVQLQTSLTPLLFSKNKAKVAMDSNIKNKKTISKKKKKRRESKEELNQGNALAMTEESITLLSVLMSKNKEQVGNYVMGLTASSEQEFHKMVQAIHYMYEKYQNQNKITETLKNVCQQARKQIQDAQQLQEDEKNKRLAQIDKIITQKFMNKVVIGEQLNEQKMMKSYALSKKTIKKSQKTLKKMSNNNSEANSLREVFDVASEFQQVQNDGFESSKQKNNEKGNQYQQFDRQSEQSSSNSRISAMAEIEDSKSDVAKLSYHQSKMGTLKSKMGQFCKPRNLISDKIQTNQELDQQLQYFDQNGHIENQPPIATSRKLISRLRNAKMKTLQPQTQDVSLNVSSKYFPEYSIGYIIPPHQQQKLQSLFKSQNSTQIKGKKIKQQINRRQFLEIHHETKKKGIAELRKNCLDKLIIDQADSVLTKKIKLRKLKEIMNMKRGVGQEEMLKQILAYISLYEAQCQLILRNGYDASEKKLNGQQSDFGQLLQQNMLLHQLKFVKLSQNYFYGESQFDDLNYNFTGHEYFQNDQLKHNQQKMVTTEQAKMNIKLKQERQDDLLQKEVPQKVEFYIKNEILPHKILSISQPNQSEQNCTKILHKRIKQFIEKRKEDTLQFQKSIKFLLTQNSVRCKQDSIQEEQLKANEAFKRRKLKKYSFIRQNTVDLSEYWDSTNNLEPQLIENLSN